MRTTRSGSRWVRKAEPGWTAWLAIAASALPGACAASGSSPAGPRPEPPEYVAPRVLPWDAGSSAEPDDPFAAAATGDWLPPSESKEVAIDAGSGGPSASQAAESNGAATAGDDAGVASPTRLLDAADAAPAGHAQ